MDLKTGSDAKFSAEDAADEELFSDVDMPPAVTITDNSTSEGESVPTSDSEACVHTSTVNTDFSCDSKLPIGGALDTSTKHDLAVIDSAYNLPASSAYNCDSLSAETRSLLVKTALSSSASKCSTTKQKTKQVSIVKQFGQTNFNSPAGPSSSLTLDSGTKAGTSLLKSSLSAESRSSGHQLQTVQGKSDCSSSVEPASNIDSALENQLLGSSSSSSSLQGAMASELDGDESDESDYTDNSSADDMDCLSEDDYTDGLEHELNENTETKTGKVGSDGVCVDNEGSSSAKCTANEVSTENAMNDKACEGTASELLTSAEVGADGVTEKPKKRRKKKKKSDEDSKQTGEKGEKPSKKRRKKTAELEDPSADSANDALAKKTQYERRNIRKIFDDENLDEETKAAQKEEMERRRRLQEIQEKLRQQAMELRAQREQEMKDALEQLKNSALKSLLEDKDQSPPGTPIVLPSKLSKSVKPPAGADVVEISSSSEEEEEEEEEDDSDSIIMMSEEEEEDEVDIQNSGSHVNDALNQRDAMGGVLVNIGHPMNEQDIYLAPQLAAVVKPHQIGGIRFLYDNVIESLERFKTSTGLGCILAHSMGLGKTLQVISFVDVFLRHTGAKSVLIIVPVNTLQNWVNEFNMWLPAAPANTSTSSTSQSTSVTGADVTSGSANRSDSPMSTADSGVASLTGNRTEENKDGESCGQLGSDPVVEEKEEKIIPEIDGDLFRPREFKLYVVTDNMKSNNVRAKVVADWHETGGVLLLGYEMYRLLSTKRLLTSQKRAAARHKNTSATSVAAEKAAAESSIIDLEKEDSNKELLKGFHEALVKPGPDLVICDEGHRIKNSHATISQALKNIRTKRRVVLTGYPLQNNLLEYWCMVDFVRPNYLGTRQEFCNMFERPIMNGQCKDSTPEDVKLMRFRSHVLHSLLEGFVQRRGHAVLRNALPHKTEYVILVRMSPIQRKLYNAFMQLIREGGLATWANSNNPIKAFSVFCKIWNHPDILHQIVKERKEDNDLDIEDAKAAEVPGVNPSTPKTEPSAPSTTSAKPAAKRSRSKAAKQLHVSVSAPVLAKTDSNLGSSSNDTQAASGNALSSALSVPAENAVKSEIKSEFGLSNWSDSGPAGMRSGSSGMWNDNNVKPHMPGDVTPMSWSDSMPADFMPNSWHSNNGMNQTMSNNMSANSWSLSSPSHRLDMGSKGWGDTMYPPSTSDVSMHSPWMDGFSHRMGDVNFMGQGNCSNQWSHGNMSSNYWPENMNARMPQVNSNMSSGHWSDNTGFPRYPSNNMAMSGDRIPPQQPWASSGHGAGDVSLDSNSKMITSITNMNGAMTSGGSVTVVTAVGENSGCESATAGTVSASDDTKQPVLDANTSGATTEDAAASTAAAAPPPPTPAEVKKEAQMISYDWAKDLMADYVAGVIEHSGKMVILMELIDECVKLGEKILIFSQSLFTLSLIEEYLSKRLVPNTEDCWAKNRSYFRLDGSTNSMERERLINLFNAEDNDRVHIFLLSTRAGCLGINLIGASRVIVFDASWNPCHDCQAVCRVYRYGQSRCCYVYRLVTDNTMEKNIYDRQINKQGISDRIVDELNPQNLLERKQVDMLLRYEDVDLPSIDAEGFEERCSDPLLTGVVKKYHSWITKEPFTHESLLLDQQDQRLTKREKRLAQQGYEMDKKMANRPSYYPRPLGGMPINVRYTQTVGGRPVASVRPMMSTPLNVRTSQTAGGNQTRLLIPTGRSVPGLKPGVSLQQIQTTTDILIPGTNTSTDSGPSKIPAGEKVLVIKTPKGVYIRTNQGKIFAVRTAPKPGVSTTASVSVTSSVSSTLAKSTTSTVTTLAKGTSVMLSTSTSASRLGDPKKAVPIVRPLIRSSTSVTSSITSGPRMPISIVRVSTASSNTGTTSPTKSIRHVIPVSSATIVKPLTSSSAGSSVVTSSVMTSKDPAGVSWSAAANLPGARSAGINRQNRMATATRVQSTKTVNSGRAIINVVRATTGDTQLMINKGNSLASGAGVVAQTISVKSGQEKGAIVQPLRAGKATVTGKGLSVSGGAASAAVTAAVVRPHDATSSAKPNATTMSSSAGQLGNDKPWNNSGTGSGVQLSQQTQGAVGNSGDQQRSDFDGLFTGALVDDIEDMASSSSAFDEFRSGSAFSRNTGSSMSQPGLSETKGVGNFEPVSTPMSFGMPQVGMQVQASEAFNVGSGMASAFPNAASSASIQSSHHGYPNQHSMSSMPHQYPPPMAPYGMPAAPYPWMPPPPAAMNPMWMQQPMNIGGLMNNSSSGGVSRQQSNSSYSSLNNDGFDFLSDGASFEPLGLDSGQSLTALLADSEPPPPPNSAENSMYGGAGNSSSSSSRRNVNVNMNTNMAMHSHGSSAIMGGAATGYVPSYPGNSMMSGYPNPYHPYGPPPPMPYNPMGHQQGHYYPQPGPSASYGNPAAPGPGYYPPMHYPPGMPGMYSSGGGNSGGYMQPPGMMPPPSYNMASSHGLPADMQNSDYRVKTE